METNEMLRALYEAALKENIRTNYFDTIDTIYIPKSIIDPEDKNLCGLYLNGQKDDQRLYRGSLYRKDESGFVTKFRICDNLETDYLEIFENKDYYTKYELEEYLKTNNEALDSTKVN